MNAYLRDAVKEDMDRLFQWANDPLVRKNSFSSATIRYEEHQRWFTRLLNRKDCRQYIYMYEGEAIGQGRVTVDGETAEIGYSICADQRGGGHGSRLLQLLLERVGQDFPQVRALEGKVKPENLASQTAFQNAGFQEAYLAYTIQIPPRSGSM